MSAILKKLVLLSVVASVAIFAQTATADILWDQSDFDVWGMGFFNADAGAPPFGMAVHSVNHVTVPGGGWNVDSISTYYSALDAFWGDGITQCYVHVYDKTGPLPIDGTDDPSVDPLVPMSAVLNGDHFVLTASGLGLALGAGEYWIGVTPIGASGPFGPEIHLSSLTYYGDATASYDVYAFPPPAMWFNFNPGLDASILIEGTPGSTPVEDSTWGEIKSLYR